MAYCTADEFADYEHGALYLGTEKRAVINLKNADVIIFGNSRAQVAFSTKAVNKYFNDREVSYYLLGFGYDEPSVFAKALISKLKLHPKLVIINTDPTFFSGSISLAGSDAIAESIPSRARSELFHILDSVHGPLCARFKYICRPQSRQLSIYRSIDNGSWLWHGNYLSPDLVISEITPTKLTPWDMALLPSQLNNARQFLADLDLSQRCIVLTGVPNPYSNAEEWAAAMGQALGVSTITPKLEGLKTMDNSHMNEPSAERWSTTFLTDFDPVLENCLRPNLKELP
jgi:hypothetical protein